MPQQEVVYVQRDDESTGQPFVELSMDGDDLVLPYFHREAWSSDDRWLLCQTRAKSATWLCDWRAG